MDFKRFRTETVQDALRIARSDLGREAMILSVRTVRAAGMKGLFGAKAVEVTAAAGRQPVSGGRHVAAPPVVSAAARQSRAVAELAARLEAGGVDMALAVELAHHHLSAAPGNGRSFEALTASLADALSPLAAADREYAPVEMFIGPPGAGKTTTIAKIAAQERARGGQAPALVSADGFRVGAVEQLRLYADILGTPFRAARTPAEVLDGMSGQTRPILLDTAGRSPSDQASRELFQTMARRRGVRTHLVVAASSGRDGLRLAFEQFAEARPSRVVVTKLDESGSIAPLLGLLRERGLPVSFLGFGQRVPEHLEAASGRALAGWVTGESATATELAA
jgi:flagellar biosynthesis protein FlhF